MYFELFFTFFKLGLFTFGGGYAMLPLLKAELIERKHWLSEHEVMDYYSISQCTPGIVAVNMAIFIGYKMKGFIGSLFAVVGVVTPSLIIIIAIANALTEYRDNLYISHAFAGIRIVVIALIFDVIISMWRASISSFITGLVFVLAVGLCLWGNVYPAYIVVGAAVLGLLLRRGR